MISIITLFFIIMMVAVMLVGFYFDMSGITKKHNDAMEGHNINFIQTMKKIHAQGAGLGISNVFDVTYFVQCDPGIYNKLRGNIKLCLFVHEYSITGSPKVEKSRQFLVITKEQKFFMQLKGWINTTDKEEAVKAAHYLKADVSLP